MVSAGWAWRCCQHCRGGLAGGSLREVRLVGAPHPPPDGAHRACAACRRPCAVRGAPGPHPELIPPGAVSAGQRRAVWRAGGASPLPAPGPCWRSVIAPSPTRRGTTGGVGIRMTPHPPVDAIRHRIAIGTMPHVALVPFCHAASLMADGPSSGTAGLRGVARHAGMARPASMATSPAASGCRRVALAPTHRDPVRGALKWHPATGPHPVLDRWHPSPDRIGTTSRASGDAVLSPPVLVGCGRPAGSAARYGPASLCHVRARPAVTV
jgi:hypothetical protein